MTNSLNVVVIAEKLIAYLRTTRDEYIKADLVSKITQLAERYPFINSGIANSNMIAVNIFSYIKNVVSM